MHDIFHVHKMNTVDVHVMNSVLKSGKSQYLVPFFVFFARKTDDKSEIRI